MKTGLHLTYRLTKHEERSRRGAKKGLVVEAKDSSQKELRVFRNLSN